MALNSISTIGNLQTLEAVVEIKSSADKLYAILSSQHQNVPKASSGHIHGVEVHEGDWETSGSMKLWKYTIDGTVETLKDKVEIDEANKMVISTAMEGDVLEQYRNYKSIVQVVTPKSDDEGGNNQVKITLEYEKLNESTGEPPHKYIRFMVNVIQDIDAHLVAS